MAPTMGLELHRKQTCAKTSWSKAGQNHSSKGNKGGERRGGEGGGQGEKGERAELAFLVRVGRGDQDLPTANID